MQRVILHCDLNNFYASVECMKRPNLKDKPVAIAGNKELRHGIILAKNQIAKERGIFTGQTIWEAMQTCPSLCVLPPDFHEYLRYSKIVKGIFHDFTDCVEDFGIDESWLDVSGSQTLFGDGVCIAKQIQNRILQEVGLTVSIGVSYNKIFAKLGSDYKKPNGMTIITKENYKDIVWPLPVSSLLYVGRSTVAKLEKLGIHIIRDLATCNYGRLKQSLGKWGEHLWLFARGEDKSEVAVETYIFPVKSIGNGITPPRDIVSVEEYKLIAYVLCESIIARMREQQVVGRCVSIQLRSSDLHTYTRQKTTTVAMYTVQQICDEAVALCEKHYTFQTPLRSISISISHLSRRQAAQQLSIFDQGTSNDEAAIDEVMQTVRQRFGKFTIRRCAMKLDLELTSFDPLYDHTIHPVNYFR